MSELQKVFQRFQYEGKEVRTVIENGEAWFVAADVATLLEMDSTQVRRIDADDKGMRSIQTPGGSQEMTVINESGLYSLILGSRKLEAKKFKKWVTSEVLPSIRQTGSYSVQPAYTLPKTFSEALHMLADSVEVVESQKKALAEAAPKVEFYEAVTGSSDAVDIGTVAKVLNMGVGRNTLFEILRNEGVLMNNNQPFQKHVDSGYFRLIEQKYTKPDGSTHISIKTVVYQKGIDYIRKILINFSA